VTSELSLDVAVAEVELERVHLFSHTDIYWHVAELERRLVQVGVAGPG
jgi:hypothetical protein